MATTSTVLLAVVACVAATESATSAPRSRYGAARDLQLRPPSSDAVWAVNSAAEAAAAVWVGEPTTDIKMPKANFEAVWVGKRLRGGGKPPARAIKRAPEIKQAAPIASVMAVHGVILSRCYAGSTFGMAFAATLVTCAGLSMSGSYPAYMAGVHVALLLQAGSVGVCGVQAIRALQSPNAPLCAAASVASVAALCAMKRFKPKRD